METLSAEKLRAQRVPPGSLTVWWLGQTGFVVKSQGGTLIVIDPYLSNSAKAIGEPLGLNLDRLVPPPLAPRDLVGVDLYAMTHSHGDHLDPRRWPAIEPQGAPVRTWPRRKRLRNFGR